MTKIISTQDLQKLVAIVGPTASGKTDLSLRLAKKFNGEIINADSRAIYKYLDIGSAKPTKKEQGNIPHHLLDIALPDQVVTLAIYKQLADKKIDEINLRHRLPFLVGGTALYLYAVIDNWHIPKVPGDKKFRMKHESQNIEYLFDKLRSIDPKAARITGMNKRRIIRALEVYKKTGKKFSEQRKKGPPKFNSLILGISASGETLKRRIATRTQQMLDKGLLAEVRCLLAKNYAKDLPAFSGIHYKEVISHLDGTLSRDQMIALINKNDLNLARHQMTWFKRDKRIQWVKTAKKAEALTARFLMNTA